MVPTCKFRYLNTKSRYVHRHPVHRPTQNPHGCAGHSRAQPSSQRSDAIADTGGLSYPARRLCARFRADRPDHPDFPGRRVAAATGDRHGDGSSSGTLFAGRGHDVHPVGPGQPRLCAELWDDPHLGCADRRRLLDLPSRGHPHGPLWGRWAAGAGAGHIPGGRAGRRLAGAGFRGAGHRALGSTQPRLVRGRRADGHAPFRLDRQQATPDQRRIRGGPHGRHTGGAHSRPARPAYHRHRACGPDAADVFQECL